MSENLSINPEGATILIVDNDKNGRHFLDTVLTAAGYRTLLAENGVVALATDYGCPIDLLITDIVMPGMNGAELSVQIRKIFPNIKQLFMSGFTETAARHFGYLPDAPFLEKPIVSSRLKEKVREILGAQHVRRCA